MNYYLEVFEIFTRCIPPGFVTNLPDILQVSMTLITGIITLLTFVLVVSLSYSQLPKAIGSLNVSLFSIETQNIYQNVILPHQTWLSCITIISLADIVILILPAPEWLHFFEFPISLLIALNVIFLGFTLIKELFDNYLLGVTLENQDKINSELIVLGRFLCNSSIILSVIFVFAQIHRINLLGLIASLGLGGVAIAFASQKIIEQILWSLVLIIDRPFVVDDYIHLPDSTIGRVESIGWRSTKVRLSGKNTLAVIPNSELAQIKIENMTRARRVISVVKLNFFKTMSDEEKALTHQSILESTQDILGIDRTLTQIAFEDLTDASGQGYVQAKLIFYILGAAENSMELRKNLLEIARENIIERLQNYGVNCYFEEQTLDITQPMNI
ncbi:mechanosensitive ion channel domain-containing protein [Mastigocoleus sp. MO_188.B34]|uniref:mechanosensitive ion channel family protein n=1 Tax=Mastigocoleus sp. MO_188.B34 TaxID=3036635 RepID=UPI00262DFBE7|nr:mechanosensitive ion channel domain-containing protein [Mastigocoleus sp. MO_188.B34]MDJ0694180.1 mechanosensitive ion channel [Mastigocoleus sp. MO_188.B34]